MESSDNAASYLVVQISMWKQTYRQGHLGKAADKSMFGQIKGGHVVG